MERRTGRAGFPLPPSPMTRRRLQRAALLTLAALLVAVAGVRLADAPRQRDGAVPVRAVSSAVLYDQTFSVRQGAALVVDLGAEDVVVRTVSGTRARVRVEGEGRDAAEVFQRNRFTARATGGGLNVRTNPPRGSWSQGRRRASFTVTVEVPRRFDVSVDLGSGDVRVAPLTGDLTVDTGSGDVQIDEVSGDVAVDTGSGDVDARTLRGAAEIDTGSGDVQVGRAEGRLSADTGSGDVAVGMAEGPFVADTGSGSVEVSVGGRHDVEIDTGSGSATVRVPRRAGWAVRLDGGSVEIDRALGFQGRQERREAEGRIGDGGARLAIETGSGRIRVLGR